MIDTMSANLPHGECQRVSPSGLNSELPATQNYRSWQPATLTIWLEQHNWLALRIHTFDLIDTLIAR